MYHEYHGLLYLWKSEGLDCVVSIYPNEGLLRIVYLHLLVTADWLRLAISNRRQGRCGRGARIASGKLYIPVAVVTSGKIVACVVNIVVVTDGMHRIATSHCIVCIVTNCRVVAIVIAAGACRTR